MSEPFYRQELSVLRDLVTNEIRRTPSSSKNILMVMGRLHSKLSAALEDAPCCLVEHKADMDRDL